MFFCKIEKLNKLENEHRWKDILIDLYHMWDIDRNNDEVLLRLATESWFVLSNFENLNINDDVYDLAKEMLKEIFIYKNHNYIDDKSELIFGYMMSINPSYFCDDSGLDEEYIKYETMAKQMLENAYKKDPDNKLKATLYFGTNNKFLKQYKKARKELQSILTSLFSKETEIEKYFIEVLADNAKTFQKQ